MNKIKIPNLGKVTGMPIPAAAPKPIKKKHVDNWDFLNKYDEMVKGVYLKIVDYTNGEDFKPRRLRVDDDFTKTLKNQDKLYREWCRKSGNTGRHSMWSWDDRWAKLFKRMVKLELIEYANYPEDYKSHYTDMRFKANMDPKVIKDCQKTVFMSHL